ncbi:hypothetical protein ACIGPN_19285 [Streptomyces afghaniensis]|uniref:hypothetical protein n=1 Tax=Streptomyces afghaniensis TaxID=66865 RepID=UPI0037D724B0
MSGERVWDITYNGTATAADIRQLAGKVTRTPYTLMSPVTRQAGTVMLSVHRRRHRAG